jgi:hypothetical protein
MVFPLAPLNTGQPLTLFATVVAGNNAPVRVRREKHPSLDELVEQFGVYQDRHSLHTEETTHHHLISRGPFPLQLPDNRQISVAANEPYIKRDRQHEDQKHNIGKISMRDKAVALLPPLEPCPEKKQKKVIVYLPRTDYGCRNTTDFTQ